MQEAGDEPGPLTQRLDPRRRGDDSLRGQFRAVSTSLFLVIQGIMARRRAPTSSIWCSAPRRRVALKLAWPAAFSFIQSRTKRPDWMSSRMRFISALVAGVTTRGPETYSPYSAVLEIE